MLGVSLRFPGVSICCIYDNRQRTRFPWHVLRNRLGRISDNYADFRCFFTFSLRFLQVYSLYLAYRPFLPFSIPHFLRNCDFGRKIFSDFSTEREGLRGKKGTKKADHLLFTGDRLYHGPNFLRTGGFPHRLRKCMVPPLTHFMRNWRVWLSQLPRFLRKRRAGADCRSFLKF